MVKIIFSFILGVGLSIGVGTALAQFPVTGLIEGGTGSALSDPNDDRIFFWDDSDGQTKFLDIGTNLSITGTTLDATGGGGSGASSTLIEIDGSQVNVGVPTLNFPSHTFNITESPSDDFFIALQEIPVASTSLTIGATGLELSGNSLNLTSGYQIPTTTLMNNLASFWQTPSTRITAGTAIDWSSNTLNVDTSGTWSGNANTATALASNGSNCSAGSAPLGVDASGAVEGCTDFEEEDAGLSSIAGLTTSADQTIYTTALDTYAVTSLTAFGRSLIDDADNTTARTTLGLGSLATLSTVNNSNWSGTDLSVANGGTGVSTLTDGGILLGSGTGAITPMAVLSNGAIVVGDGTTDPVALTAFTSSTGDLIHEAGGLEADVSGYTNGLFGMLSGVTADIDTESELESALGGLDVLTVTTDDITSANLATLLSDETGSAGGFVRATSPTLTTPTFATSFTFDSVTVNNLTGVDTNIVTGTAGTAGNCAEWDANGDLVDAGAECGTGGGGSGSLSTTTDRIGLTGAVEDVNYISDDLLIGGSGSTTAEFQFDPEGASFFISSSSANATATIESTNNAQAVRLGDDAGEYIQFDFGTAGDVIVNGISSVAEWVSDLAYTISGALTLTGNFIFDGQTFDSFTDDATLSNNAGDLRVVDVNCTDCLNATEIEDIYALHAGDVYTGTHDFGGATSFELPNNGTVNANGEITTDDTSGQLRYYAGSAERVLAPEFPRSLGSIGSTSLDRTLTSFDSGTTTWSTGHANGGYTLNTIYGDTDAGTCLVRVGDGTNWTAPVVADSDGQELSGLSNNTFTDREEILIEIGSCASDPNFVTPTLMFSATAD